MSSVADNPEIFLLSCLLFICTVAYKISPPLSPHGQLKRLNRDIDDVWALFDEYNESGDNNDRRRATYIRLKQYDLGY